MEEKDLKEVCPACGVPKTAFVEHKMNISEKRLAILDLHIHPITVHLPEAIAILTVGFMVLAFLTSGGIKESLETTTKVLSFFFPITVVVAIFSGIYDGKIRFKKLSPPFLRIKMQLGIVLLVLSVVSAILFQTSFDGSGMKVLIFVLALINLVLNAVIGKLGGKLMESKMPG
jgi:uncharacterized membrane protein